MTQKRGQFIGKTNSLLQELGHVSHHVVLKLFNSSVLTLYGSNLWDLFSKDCEKLYTSFNVALRNIMKVDRCTHRFMLEPLSQMLHLKTLLTSRFVSFHKSLKNSLKFEVRFLASLYENDLRTVHGKNLGRIAALCESNVFQLDSKLVTEKLCYFKPPDSEKWRTIIGQKLLQVCDSESLQLPGFNIDEVNDLLSYICVS